jgi:hypothetical protein
MEINFFFIRTNFLENILLLQNKFLLVKKTGSVLYKFVLLGKENRAHCLPKFPLFLLLYSNILKGEIEIHHRAVGCALCPAATRRNLHVNCTV